jgi:predicted Ser/Thr protein kinase
MTTHNIKLDLPQDPFEGSFAELLPQLKVFPGYVASPKGTLNRLIQKMGRNEARTAVVRELYADQSLEALNAFSNFFGTELADNEFMTSYVGPALQGHGADKKAALFIGPPGAGKSDKVEDLKRIWRTGEPMPALEGCPIHDNPLNLLFMVPRVALASVGGKASKALPETLRIVSSLKLLDVLSFDEPEVRTYLKRNGVNGDATNDDLARIALGNVEDFVSIVTYGLELPKSTRNSIGLPCPHCQDRLFGKYSEKVEIADFPMGAMLPALGHGIVDVPEVDEINFNLAEWIGRRNIGNIGRVPSDHPDSVELNGYYPRANRGLLILTEALKNPDQAQRINLEALQGRRIPLPQPLAPYHESGLHVELFVIAHSNEAEYLNFLGDSKKEPYWDRFHRIYMKYPLEAEAASKVTRKMWGSSSYSKSVERGGVHVEPVLFDYEGRLRVLASLEEDTGGVPLMVKLAAYNGEQVRATGMGTVINVADLRTRASDREGMQGISPRQTAESVIGGLAQRALKLHADGLVESPCVTTKDFELAMFDYLKANVKDKKKREALAGFLSKDLAIYRRKTLSKYVRAAFLEQFSTECQSTFDKFIEWSNASILGGTPKSAGSSRITKYEMDEWLKKIENMPQFGVSDGQKDRFRREVQAAVLRYREEHGSGRVPYTVHQGLKECIERFVLSAVSDVVRILSEKTSYTTEDQKKLDSARGRLINEHHFCKHCANALFDEVSSTRGFIID